MSSNSDQKSEKSISRASTLDFNAEKRSKSGALSKFLACFLHILFKLLVLLSYFPFSTNLLPFNPNFSYFTLSFSVALTFALADFYVVKNFTAPNLLGLVWYFEVRENGHFDLVKRRENSHSNRFLFNYFWVLTYTWQFFWVVYTLLRLFFFDFGSVVFSVLVSLVGSVNVYNCSTLLRDKTLFSEYKLKFAKLFN